ncbi:MAG TPA: hypothetical protein VMV34_08590 [Terriglobia bacterium]|nr:hypothetical protein [Terriglobia bacterium]
MHSGKPLSCLGIILLIASLGAAQSPPQQPLKQDRVIPLTIQKGVPIRVALVKSVRVKHAGAPVEGRVLDPVYVFDREVIPSGSKIQGRVTKIDPISKGRRIGALANGNFTPFHTVHLEFTSLTLKNGKRLPIETVVSQGEGNVVRLEAGGAAKKKPGLVHGKVAEARQQIQQQKKAAIQAIEAPGKFKRLEGMLSAQLSAELPYHRQSIKAGTQFFAQLKTPLELGTEDCSEKELEKVGSEIPPGSIVHVWLATPLSSATDHKGSAVEAVVSQPVFSSQQQLILPQGARLEGFVTEAVPARHLNRNGRLRFTFRRVQLPQGVTRQVEAGLHAANVPKADHLKIDSEGGAHATTSKTKFVMPAIDVLLASSSIDGDSGQRAIQEGSGGSDVAGGAVRGGVGLGLVGSVVAMAARSQALTAGFAFYGAAWSVYSHLMARGSDVVFPRDTAMEIRFGTHDAHAAGAGKAKALPSGKAAPPNSSST